MDIFSLPLRIAIVAAAALVLGWLFRGYLRRNRNKLQHMLDVFFSVLDGPRAGLSPWGYEFVEGSLEGRPARVSLLPDSLITRTLPTLWLELRWTRPHDAWLCVILAANGMEYFSDDVDEGTRMVSPGGWPEGVIVRGKGPQSVALARRLHSLDLTAYDDLKMFTLSATETKLIMRCSRADVPYYRAMRTAEFPADSVTPELVVETLRVLHDIERTLAAAEEVA